jgi:hypothetical protein
MPAPISTTDKVSELPAVGYNPPVPGGSCALPVVAAFCIDAPVPKGATGAEAVVVSDAVELAARNTDGNSDSGDSGAVPNGGGEDNAGFEDEDEDEERSAGANIELLDEEGALSGAGCVELTATVEFLSETIHVPCQSTLYNF